MQDTQQSKRKQMTTTNNGKTERQPVTAVTVAQLLFLENSFQKHKILTSFKYF